MVMSIRTIPLLVLCALVLAALPAQAQTEELLPIETEDPGESSEAELNENRITPVITSEDFIAVNKKALFDASDSTLLPTEEEPTYRWDFTDSPVTQFGRDITHEFNAVGIHEVTLTISQEDFNQSIRKEIFVYDKQILMITDKNIEEKFELIVEQAANNGVLLKVVSSAEQETGFLTEEKLVPLIGEEAEFIKTADGLIFYTNASLGLQAFTRYWQSLEDDKKIELNDTVVIKITDDNMAIAADLAQQSFEVLNARYILLTRKEALNPIFELEDYNLLTTELSNRVIEYRIIDERSEKSEIFFLSHAITTFIAKGIPTNTIYLVLAFPFIAFVITFVRQVIGISVFGIYTPTVIALSLLILGIYFGLGTLIIVVVVSYLLRKLLNRFKLLYIPKTSLILSAIALSFLMLIWFLSYYRVSLAVSLAIFPMLVMSTLSEKFLSAQSEEGLREALFGVIKTAVIAIGAYYLVEWSAFQNLIMSWPELILAPILGIILLGRFTGLRFTEYIRFRSLFKEKQIEE